MPDVGEKVDKSVLVAIMSYNRGKFLKNLVTSIEKNCQFIYDLVIMDDGSDDPYTKEVLQEYEASVYRSSVDPESIKHKGLYANMNRALQMAIKQEKDQLLILQDDTQIVRKIPQSEINGFDDIFGNREQTAQIVATFFKKNHQKPYKKLLDFHPDTLTYTPKSDDQHYMTGIADMGFFSIKKLEEANWNFESDEATNLRTGRYQKLNREVLRLAAVAYLPWPSTYRYRGSLPSKFIAWAADKLYHAGFHPLSDFTEDQLDAIRAQDPWQVVFEEDYLTNLDGVRLKKPWNYYKASFEFKRSIKRLLRLKMYKKD